MAWADYALLPFRVGLETPAFLTAVMVHPGLLVRTSWRLNLRSRAHVYDGVFIGVHTKSYPVTYCSPVLPLYRFSRDSVSTDRPLGPVSSASDPSLGTRPAQCGVPLARPRFRPRPIPWLRLRRVCASPCPPLRARLPLPVPPPAPPPFPSPLLTYVARRVVVRPRGSGYSTLGFPLPSPLAYQFFFPVLIASRSKRRFSFSLSAIFPLFSPYTTRLLLLFRPCPTKTVFLF